MNAYALKFAWCVVKWKSCVYVKEFVSSRPLLRSSIKLVNEFAMWCYWCARDCYVKQCLGWRGSLFSFSWEFSFHRTRGGVIKRGLWQWCWEHNNKHVNLAATLVFEYFLVFPWSLVCAWRSTSCKNAEMNYLRCRTSDKQVYFDGSWRKFDWRNWK